MATPSTSVSATVSRDLLASVVVFLVAVPLCLGIALASQAPLFSGLVAGIVGGILVGSLSGSHTSVSGPAAGLAAVVAAEIASLGSFQTFLLALVLAGLIQMVLGIARAGVLAAFVPSGVVKGLLAAIGILLILKQIPHVLGRDADPEGDMAFQQPDHENTFSELWLTASDLLTGEAALGAALIGLLSLGVLIFWENYKPLKKSLFPAPLFVVLLGVALSRLFHSLGGAWVVEESHLVQVPVAANLTELRGFLQTPNFSQWVNPAVYVAAVTIAAVASLETLLNLQAVDKIDPERRTSPPNQELFAQGVGNMVSGLIGGLPITSVIVRSSVNVAAGGKTRWVAILHGVLLLVSVVFLPTYLNLIPLSTLAAILLVTGFKLASPKLFRQMWSEGGYQFAPFALTVLAIVLTDILIGIVIGLAVSMSFILWNNARRPIHQIVEKHLGGDVVHIQLANQVSFLNRAALSRVLQEVPRGGHVLLDAQTTDYIDPDILELIRDYTEQTAPARGVKVSLLGFRDRYSLHDQTQYVDYSTRELQSAITPEQVLQILKDGNERFQTGQRLTRDLGRQVSATALEQHPLAVVLSCIDSRTPAELIFDLGVGDIFSVRVAGNVTSRKILGSMEYGCAVAGAKLILVVGHTHCGAVTAAVNLSCSTESAAQATGCQHLDFIIQDIQTSLDPATCQTIQRLPETDRTRITDEVALRNVIRVVQTIVQQSQTLGELVRNGTIGIVGAMYDVASGKIDFVTASTDRLAEVGNATNTFRA
jgi:carbonic anhydrase/SulP family sulfate permease